MPERSPAAPADNPGGHPSLAAALVAFQAEMPKVAKNQTARIPGKNGAAGYSYTYADLPDVSDATVPVLTRHGLSFVCTPRATPGGSYELTGLLIHALGDQLEGSLPLTGRAAQEIGSSITYARRYLLGCMTGVITDDDEDGSIANAANERLREAPSEADTLRTQIMDLARERGIAPATILSEWSESHDGQHIGAATDVGGLELVRDDLRTRTVEP